MRMDAWCFFCFFVLAFEPMHIFYLFDTAPYHHPQNLSLTALDSTSIRITWEPPPRDLINGVLRYYHVTVYNIINLSVYNELIDADSRLDVIVNELHPYYSYNCTVAAVTVAEGPLTSAVVMTLEDGKQAVIKGQYVAI